MGTTLRITLSPPHVRILAQLLTSRQKQLRALGVAGEVSPSMLVSGLLEQAARAEGLELGEMSVAGGSSTADKSQQKRADPLTVRLRKKRLSREMTQAEVAEFFGLRQATLALIESGRRPVPRRLRLLVERWLRNATVPTSTELPAPQPRLRWQRILEDSVVPHDDEK